MGFIGNAFHSDRKCQENWCRFSNEVGGFLVTEGESGGDEVHIPFMGYRIEVSNKTDGRNSRTVMTLGHSSEEFQFKIFGWGDSEVPQFDRDPYLNSEFPGLASRAKVEFNNVKKLSGLLASAEIQESIADASDFFTLEAGPDSISLDNRAFGSKDNGVIKKVSQLREALDLLKCISRGMRSMESGAARN
jgi:hypothetical protein